MPQTVTAPPELDVVATSQATRDVTSPHDFIDAVDDVCKMMQLGSRPLDKNDVVLGILAVQEDADRLTSDDHIIQDSKPKIGVEACRQLDVGSSDLVVIEAKGAPAPNTLKLLVNSLDARHGGAKFQRGSADVRSMQGT